MNRQQRVNTSPSSALIAAWHEAADRGPAALALSGHGPDDLVVLWASSSLLTLLQVEPEEMTGRLLLETGDLLGPAASDLAGLVRAGGGTTDSQLGDATGPADVVLEVHPGGHPAQWLGRCIVADAQEMASFAAAQEAQQRFIAVAEHAPVGIAVSEAGLRLGYANGHFCSLLGRSQVEILGTTWAQAFHLEDHAALDRAVGTSLRGEPSEVTVRTSPAAEGVRWVHLRFAPVTTAAKAAGFVVVAEDVTERKAWADQVLYRADHDPLTGLVNRHHLEQQLKQARTSLRVRDRRVGVVLLDVDAFSTVNDEAGRDNGDRLLVELGHRLRASARTGDLCARVEADRFAVLLRDVDGAADVTSAAARLRQSVVRPYRVGSYDITVSVTTTSALPLAEDPQPQAVLNACLDSLGALRQGGAARVAPVVQRVAPAGTGSV